MKNINNNDIIDYVAGHLNLSSKYDVEDVKSCILNALNMLEDEQDGILSVLDRKVKVIEYYLHLESGDMLKINKLEYDYTDQYNNRWFYCDTEKGRFHTTHKDIYRNIL